MDYTSATLTAPQIRQLIFSALLAALLFGHSASATESTLAPNQLAFEAVFKNDICAEFSELRNPTLAQLLAIPEICQPFTEIVTKVPDDCTICPGPAPTIVINSGAGAAGSNLGVTAAQSRAATQSADQQRRQIESRLNVRKGEGKGGAGNGGGASADFASGPWGVFFSTRYTDTERKQTLLENGYDSDQIGLTLGADYRLSDRLLVGAALGYSEDDADYEGNGGGMETDARTLTLYGNFSPTADSFVDFYIGYSRLDYYNQRNIDFTTQAGTFTGTAVGGTDGDQMLAGLAAGYAWSHKAWTVQPEINLDYANTDIDGYAETGADPYNQIYPDQTIESLESSIAVRGTYAISTDWGVVVPQARLAYVHQWQDESRSIPTSFVLAPNSSYTFVTDSPDRNYLNLNLGASIVMRDGIQAFVDYERLMSHSFLDVWTIAAGVRFEL